MNELDQQVVFMTDAGAMDSSNSAQFRQLALAQRRAVVRGVAALKIADAGPPWRLSESADWESAMLLASRLGVERQLDNREVLREAGVPLKGDPSRVATPDVLATMRESAQQGLAEAGLRSTAAPAATPDPLRMTPEARRSWLASQGIPTREATSAATGGELERGAGDDGSPPAHQVIAELAEVLGPGHEDRAAVDRLKRRGAALDVGEIGEVQALATRHADRLARLHTGDVGSPVGESARAELRASAGDIDRIEAEALAAAYGLDASDYVPTPSREEAQGALREAMTGARPDDDDRESAPGGRDALVAAGLKPKALA